MDGVIGSESAMRIIWESVAGTPWEACGSLSVRDFLGKSF